MPDWEQYVRDVWPSFPTYTFYQLNMSSLSWEDKTRTFIYSNLSQEIPELKKKQDTKFFQIYEVVPKHIHTPLGYVFRVRENVVKEIPYKLYFTTHSISICTDIMTFEEVSRLEKKIVYETKEITIASYGNDAEVISDISHLFSISSL